MNSTPLVLYLSLSFFLFVFLPFRQRERPAAVRTNRLSIITTLRDSCGGFHVCEHGGARGWNFCDGRVFNYDLIRVTPARATYATRVMRLISTSVRGAGERYERSLVGELELMTSSTI